MASKLEYLKKYDPKKKKKHVKKSENFKKPIDFIKSDTLSNDFNLQPKTLQPGLDNFNSESEEDEKPSFFLEDGVTAVSKKVLTSMASNRSKWVPLEKNTAVEPPGSVRRRHDSDSDDNDDYRHSTRDVTPAFPFIKNEKNHKPLFQKIETVSHPSHTPFFDRAKSPDPQKTRDSNTGDIKWGVKSSHDEEKQQTLMDIAYEMSKPLARYKDDADLENHLKSKLHAEDPLYNYMVKPDLEKEVEIEKGKFKKPLSISQNRFNIPAGKRWDGVDRSNGFERKRVDRIGEIQNQEQEAFMFFSEDI